MKWSPTSQQLNEPLGVATDSAVHTCVLEVKENHLATLNKPFYLDTLHW